MIAGSETTATLLSGCVYIVQKDHWVPQKLQAEIRDTSSNDKDNTMLSVSHLVYLDAVIQESLRIYPPVPIASSRSTPPEGAIICGHYVPGNASLLLSFLEGLLISSIWPSAFRNMRHTPHQSILRNQNHSTRSVCF
jgi:cytochrome P450